MRTTDGRNAFATAENAEESTRASLGAWVRGVTGPPAGSAGDSPGAFDAAGCCCCCCEGARRWQALATASSKANVTARRLSSRRYLAISRGIRATPGRTQPSALRDRT